MDLTLSASALRDPRAPGLHERLARRAFHRLLSRLADGELTLVDAGGRTRFGRPGGLRATVEVRDPRFYPAALLGGAWVRAAPTPKGRGGPTTWCR